MISAFLFLIENHPFRSFLDRKAKRLPVGNSVINFFAICQKAG